MEIDEEIDRIFKDNKINDLKRFIKKKERLNNWNYYMMYLFYITQSAGILTTSIATSNNYTNYIWVGIGLNMLASLLRSYEEYNNNIIKKLHTEINDIKNGTYIDENVIVDTKNNNSEA